MVRMIPSLGLLRQLSLACDEAALGASLHQCARTMCVACQQGRTTLSHQKSAPRRGDSYLRRNPQCRGFVSAASPSNTSTSTNTPHQPDTSSHYTLFPQTVAKGPPPKGPFRINLQSLRKEFLQLQSQYHPDRYNPDEPSHGKTLVLSARINEAYKTLSDPLLRAQYILLQTYGVDVTSEDNSSHSSDPETLMEVMETQESIEDAQTEEQIDELKVYNAQRIENTVNTLADAFETSDIGAATRECVRLRYWRSLGEGLHSWEPGKEVKLVH